MSATRPITARTPWYTLLLLLFFSASPANADIGVPMLLVTLPGMVIGLVPIIFVEAFVLARQHRVTLAYVLKPVAWANVLSTLVDVPLTWFVLLALELATGGGSGGPGVLVTTRQKFLAVTWQAPWLIPYDSELHWMIPTAMLVLLVPFFFASWLTEYWIIKRLVKDFASVEGRHGVMLANLASYFLLLFWVAYLYLSYPR